MKSGEKLMESCFSEEVQPSVTPVFIHRLYETKFCWHDCGNTFEVKLNKLGHAHMYVGI